MNEAQLNRKASLARELGLTVIQDYRMISNEFNITLEISKNGTRVESYIAPTDKQAKLNSLKDAEKSLTASLTVIRNDITKIERL